MKMTRILHIRRKSDNDSVTSLIGLSLFSLTYDAEQDEITYLTCNINMHHEDEYDRSILGKKYGD
jgi:hypothetical protein